MTLDQLKAIKHQASAQMKALQKAAKEYSEKVTYLELDPKSKEYKEQSKQALEAYKSQVNSLTQILENGFS